VHFADAQALVMLLGVVDLVVYVDGGFKLGERCGCARIKKLHQGAVRAFILALSRWRKTCNSHHALFCQPHFRG